MIHNETRASGRETSLLVRPKSMDGEHPRPTKKRQLAVEERQRAVRA